MQSKRSEGILHFYSCIFIKIKLLGLKIVSCSWCVLNEWEYVLKLQMIISGLNLYQIYVCFSDDMKDFKDCLSFLKRHSLLFSQWPALFVQTALNEPCDSSAHLWAESMTRNGGVHAIKWLNCTDAAQKEVRYYYWFLIMEYYDHIPSLNSQL